MTRSVSKSPRVAEQCDVNLLSTDGAMGSLVVRASDSRPGFDGRCHQIPSEYTRRGPIFYDKFTMQEMSVALEAMDCRKSPGPDNIHVHMVKHLGDKDKQRLLEIFNLSWKLGRRPWE
ncbi:hypothetical protein TNCV_4622341 [Trichonephila clavipes]|nr:hypothetical protein TNCV_4622341 [Trichonephila clavipes]